MTTPLMRNMRRHFTNGTPDDMMEMDRSKSIAPYNYRWCGCDYAYTKLSHN